MKKIIGIFILVSLSLTKAISQQNKLPRLKLTLGYYGETVTHQGLHAGIEYYPYQSEKYQMILSPAIGGYVHIRNNTSVFIRGQWGQRVRFRFGIFLDQFIGLGYLRQYTHGGESFEVLPNGAVVKIKDKGNSMIMPSVALGTGYDFSGKSKRDISFFLRPELFWKAPFNGYYLTHLAIHTGIIFKPGKRK